MNPNPIPLSSALNDQGFQNLNQMIEDCFTQFGEKPAFTSLGCTLSYAELDRWSAAFAAYLQNETDLKPGDRLAIQLPNLIQYPIVVYGAIRAGIVLVNTNPLYTPNEMLHQFRDSGAKALVVHASMAHKAQKILKDTQIGPVLVTQIGDFCPPVKGMLLNLAIRHIKKMEPAFSITGAKNLKAAIKPYLDAGYRAPELSLDDICAIQYTGGTTGVCKGAVLSHGNLIANILQGKERMSGVAQDWSTQVISPLPLYHIYAFTVAQIIAARGGHSVLIPNPRDLKGFVKELKRWQPTTFIGLNTLFIGLASTPGIDTADFSRLRLNLSGGMSLTHKAERLWHQITGQPVVEAYGLTEASPAVTTTLPLAPRVGSIGIPLSETEVKIVDADLNPLPPGQAGELLVRGPQVMRAYWRQPQETQRVFTDDGFLHTGDIATQDPDGYLHIVDRAKDLIIVSGFNVYPTEVEDRVCEYPSVKECAAVGVPHEAKGEVVKLFVVMMDDETLDDQALKAFCKQHLAAYKCPSEIVSVPELPKTPVGKVLRRALRDI